MVLASAQQTMSESAAEDASVTASGEDKEVELGVEAVEKGDGGDVPEVVEDAEDAEDAEAVEDAEDDQERAALYDHVPPSTPDPSLPNVPSYRNAAASAQQWQFAWQTRELCLHYYSNTLKFKFGNDSDVYRVDQIKEWAELENPIWLDNLREMLFKIAGII